MKKLLFVTQILFLISVTSFAQIEKGTFMFGGDISYYSSKNHNQGSSKKTDFNSNTWYDFDAKAGYFMGKNFALGMALGYHNYVYTYQYTPSDYKEKDTRPRYSISPFARYYKMLGEQFGFLGQASLGYNFGENTERYLNSMDEEVFNKMKEKTYGASLSTGIVFFPTKKVGLELLLGSISYSHRIRRDDKADTKVKNDNFNFNINLKDIGLGIMLYL